MATAVEEFITGVVEKAEKPLTQTDLLFVRGSNPQPFTTDAIRIALWKLIDEGTLELGKDGKLRLKG